MSEKTQFNDTESFENEQKLDDIVLQQYQKKEKIKRFALLGISFFLLFILVLIGVKSVLNESTPPQEQFVESMQEMPNEESDEFESVPILSQESDTLQETKINDVVQELLTKKEPPKEQTTKPSKPQPPTKTVTHEKKSIEKPKREQPTHVARKEQPKKVTPVKKEKKKTSHQRHYYIQVGAFLKSKPDRDFLRKIEAKGFSYTIKRVKRNGQLIAKVLVGPFKSKREARSALKKVKRSIVSGAFIVRL